MKLQQIRFKYLLVNNNLIVGYLYKITDFQFSDTKLSNRKRDSLFTKLRLQEESEAEQK